MDGSPDPDRFTSRRSTVYARNGLVATEQPLAAEAGLEMLREGGNAFDAAVATAAVLNVTAPAETGLGGDVFLLYRTADGDVGGMQSCGGAPADATLDAVRESVAGPDGDPDTVEMPDLSPHAVTVPGTARGWEAAVETHGRLEFGRTLQPAIRYAREGFPVMEMAADFWTGGERLFTEAHARETFLNDGHAPRAGEVFANPDLGDSLAAIAEDGADAFYEGPIGERVVEAVRSRGGFLSMSDLESFEPEFVDPVSTTYNGVEVYELPPNNQGLITLEALNIAEELDAGEHDYRTPERVHYFAEAMKLAFHDGHRYITDPDYEAVPPLASKSWARKRASEVGPQATEDASFRAPGGAEDADTALLTAADGAGNVVALINSLFSSTDPVLGFGSGIVPEGTGIVLQNRGASFSLDPDDPNHIEPDKRPFHTLIPAVAHFGEDDWAAFGCMGGATQPQGQVQMLANAVDYDMPLQAALDAPRWVYRADGTLGVEGRFDGHLLTKVARKGHDVRIMEKDHFGGAQVARYDDGVLSGATEPRKDGSIAQF
ncbi:gamma-glutamyltransferase [Halobacteriales archaeon QH_3_68_24]|nr:MAG: gamma-glutamyltransferase [Halobacteriales archaeon QH_3_68_24]